MVVHNLAGTKAHLHANTSAGTKAHKHVNTKNANDTEQRETWYSAGTISDSAACWLFGADINNGAAIVGQKSLEKELEDIKVASMEDFLQDAGDAEDAPVNQSSMLCTFNILSCASANTIDVELANPAVSAEDRDAVSPTSVVDATSCSCDSQNKHQQQRASSSDWIGRRNINVEAQWAQDAIMRGNRRAPDPFETPLSEFGLYDYKQSPHRNPNTGTGSGHGMLSEMDWVRLLGNRYKPPRYVVVQRSGCNPHFTSANPNCAAAAEP